MASPAKRMRLSSQRASLSGNRQSVTVTTPSQTALRTSTNAANRAASATSQSTGYDIVTNQPLEPSSMGGKPRRPSLSQSHGGPAQSLRRSTSKQSMLPQPTPSAPAPASAPTVLQQKYQDDMLVVQARINKLEYEIQNLEADQGEIALKHEKELREAQAKSEADYRKYQEAESERLKAVRLHENAMKEIRDIRDRGVNDAAALEKKVRELQGQLHHMREEKDDLEHQLSDAQREIRRLQVEEVEGARTRLERTMRETAAELEEMKSRFETVNTKLHAKETYAEELEKKVLEVSGNTGGGEELAVLKREFSEQVASVRRLESLDREQRATIRRLEDERRSVHVVLEEKRALEVQVQVLKESERRAAELEMQKEILEDEKRTWTTLLDKGGEEDQPEFETPEAVVKALVHERIEHALARERLGAVESEMIGKDEALRAVESERHVLKRELEQAKAAAAKADGPLPEPESKVIKRLERQHQLAQKEIDYLKAQLDTFNAEETTMMENSNFDAQRAEQITRLEGLVSDYKAEIDHLHSRLATLEATPPGATPLPVAGRKRAAESTEVAAEHVGHLTRKNKNLQVALEKVTGQSQLLAKELQATKAQIKALRASHAQRILELRDNPTAQHEAIKASTLRTLKQENTELMAQLRGDAAAMKHVRVVPVSSLDALKQDLADMQQSLADKEKRMRRQREIWTEKAAEFRDVISSVLGYKVTFLPNGKVKVRSIYYNPPREEGEEMAADEDDREDYIEFDGEKGTMKIGGGRDGAFGKEIAETIHYWVGEQKEIPCFLAAMTLEFYEKFGGVAPPRSDGAG